VTTIDYGIFFSSLKIS